MTGGGHRGSDDKDGLAATRMDPASPSAAGAPTVAAAGTPAPEPRQLDPLGATAVERGPMPTRAHAREPGVATQIDRFVVIDKIGAGGMGIVLAAFDPKLDRKVAIKMLHDDVSEGHGARLEREAKAMAQLSHPNVVTVHETGSYDGRLYIAMEYVEGQTVSGWLRAAPRSRDEILDMYVQAGRGLAAAHAVGLVHRDFKPDNILVGKDGRCRVSDFGLVSAVGESQAGPASPGAGSGVRSPSSLTLTGAVMGTPLYMAPEQHAGKVADAKADQFSFCVALWQALCDEPPYGADTYETLVENVTGGKLRPVPRGARVPAAVRDILSRGLDASPDRRHPSMHALLAALERARQPRRWPWIAAGVAVLAGGATAAVVMFGGDRNPCGGGERRLTGVWDATRKAELSAALLGVSDAAAQDVWHRVGDNLDAHAAGWIRRHQDACEATQIRGEQSAELMDLRMGCLDRRLASLDALVDRIAEDPTRDTVWKALDATAGLDLADCDDDKRLRAAIPLPADATQRAKILALETRYAEAESFDKLGRYARSQEIATEVAQEAKAVGYPPLEAKAVLVRAAGEWRSGDLALAEASYREAAEAAARARDDHRIAQSWIDLMSVFAAQGKPDAALELLAVARTAAERVSDDVKLGARLANVLGGIHLAKADYKQARVEYDRALALVERDGPTSSLRGHALHNVATVMWYTGELDKAAENFAAARAIFVAQLGPRHPSLGYVSRNLGDLAIAKGDLDGAIVHYRDAAAIFEGAHGPDHIDVAIAYEPLAYALVQKQDAAGARQAAEKALAVREAKLGPDHPLVAQTLLYVADAESLDGTPPALGRAMERLGRALTIQEATIGRDHITVAATLDRMAQIDVAQGHPAAALARLERGLAIRVKILGEHNDVAYSHFRIGEAELALKHLEAAHAAFERAYQLWNKLTGGADPDVAKAKARMDEVRAMLDRRR